MPYTLSIDVYSHKSIYIIVSSHKSLTCLNSLTKMGELTQSSNFIFGGDFKITLESWKK